MGITLRQGLIFGMIKGHGEVSTISYSGDNKVTRITTLLKPQSGSNRTSARKDRANLSDPSRRLHVSVAEIGGYSNMPKSEPSGRERINPHTRVNSKGVVERNPARLALLDEVQDLIKS